MSEKTSMKWHEIINGEATEKLAFFDLYREYADALKEREARKREAQYWPFPRE